jgi:protein ImuB
MLWIALHLPRLSLESWLAVLPPEQREQPAALMGSREVLMCNPAAQRLGVRPGLQRVTALALAPHLQLGRIDAARDRQVLTSVAHVALAFTPAVCWAETSGPAAEPGTVLLQVQASLRYFGGLTPLLQRLRAALAPLNCTLQFASAPTAQGAAVLACCSGNGSDELHATDLPQLEGLLGAAPLWLIGTGRAQWAVLDSMGLGTFGALRRLPRPALRRRFGPALLDELDTVLGMRCEPPPAWITLPETFEVRIELQTRADTTDQLLHGAQLLIDLLLAWARAQQARVRRYTLFMHHERHRRQREEVPVATELSIALAEASCDAAHLSLLLRERLAHLSLPAPTLELRLHCADVVRGSPHSAELFASARGEREGLVRLIERLQARLGAEQVQQLRPMADHRPECDAVFHAVSADAVGSASRQTGRRPSPAPPAVPEPELSTAQAVSAPRPIWLLDEPQRLAERQSRPLLDGQPLQLLCGPERIEVGWWDAQLAGRDYFIAQTPDGALVWLYRARLPLSVAEDAQGWFVHGRFG